MNNIKNKIIKYYKKYNSFSIFFMGIGIRYAINDNRITELFIPIIFPTFYFGFNFFRIISNPTR